MKGAGDYVSPSVFRMGIEQYEGLEAFSNIQNMGGRDGQLLRESLVTTILSSVMELHKPFTCIMGD
jgi:hypothetical protein